MTNRKLIHIIDCVLIAASLLLVSGCSFAGSKSDDDSGSDNVIKYEIPDDDEDETEGDVTEVEYSPSLFYDYWNEKLIPKYGTAKQVKEKIGEESCSFVTGSVSVCICDIDDDGQDEMIHVCLGKYGDYDASEIIEIYEFVNNRVRRAATSVVSTNIAYYGNSTSSVFLSRKNKTWYICCEKFGDYLGKERTTEYLIFKYNGKELIHYQSIVDPGFPSVRTLFYDPMGNSFVADDNGVYVFNNHIDKWDGLYKDRGKEQISFLKEKGLNLSCIYDDYKTAITSVLSEFGLSFRFSGDGINLGANQNAKTITRICTHITTYEGTGDKVSLNAVICDYTGCLYHVDQSESDELPIDDKLQYNLNIYLSNFAEVDMRSFDGMPDTDDLIYFGIFHNIKNNSKTVDTKVSEEYIYRMSTGKIADAIYKYFFVRTDESDFRTYAKSDEWMTYKKGYLYSTDVAEGAPWGDFTVVSRIDDIGKNLYLVTFRNYDINSFYDRKSDGSKPYSLTPADVKKMELEKDMEGTAVIYASDLSKRSTYRLMSYNLK